MQNGVPFAQHGSFHYWGYGGGATLHPDVRGQGYATEAASAMLDYAFGVLKLHRVRAELDPRNTESVALCLRLGMREEAHFIEDMTGEWAARA